MRVLIVEDDDRLAEALQAFLGRSGYETARVATGAEAVEAVRESGDATSSDAPGIEVVLLDLGLPDIDGLDVCRRFRSFSPVPIVIATARSQVEERIKGLQAGADDFVVKPYDARELVARIEAIVRRSRAFPGEMQFEQAVELGAIRIDFAARQLLVSGSPVDLIPKEFDIVGVLARYPGVAVPSDRLIRDVWGTDWTGYKRSLEVHLASIRRKLGREPLIETVRGVGYRLING